MKEVLGPISGFKVLEGPANVSARLHLMIDERGLESAIQQGFRRLTKSHSFDQVTASAENGNLVLTLSGERYVLETKIPERLVKKIEDVRERARQKTEERERKAAMMCSICKRPQANAVCVQCNEKVCPSHSNLFQGQVYCIRCKVVCPKCRSDQISAHKRGFKLGRAVAGTLVGGIILGGLIGAIGSGNVELMCHTCGHRWQPHL